MSYAATIRSLRLHGVVTSVRLENLFWDTLEEIATRDGMNVPQLLSKLYGELLAHRGDIPNYSSFLRVCCQRYLALQVDNRIPKDLSIPIRSLNPHAVLHGARGNLVDQGQCLIAQLGSEPLGCISSQFSAGFASTFLKTVCILFGHRKPAQ